MSPDTLNQVAFLTSRQVERHLRHARFDEAKKAVAGAIVEIKARSHKQRRRKRKTESARTKPDILPAPIEPPGIAPLDEMPLADIGLSSYTLNALDAAGIYTVEQFERQRVVDLLAIRNFSEGRLATVRTAIRNSRETGLASGLRGQ